ncbi:MAG: GAF domain-containing protein [Chloroflexi bacterium]|nr:GAF domain-containing protein [Chloroflexota bacterium]
MNGEIGFSFFVVVLSAICVGFGFALVAILRESSQRKRAERKLHDQIAALQALADENARLLDESKRRATEMAALQETTRDLAAQQQDLSTLLQTIVARATSLLAVPHGHMYLYDKQRGDLELVAASESFPLAIGTRLTLDVGMVGRVAQTRQPIFVDDYQSWENRSRQHATIPFTAVLQVPMLYQGDLVGVLGVEEIGSHTRKFAEADARLLTLFAAQAASIVHNARLFNETHTRAEQLALLYDAGLTLNRVLEPKTQLEFLFKIAVKALHADRATFYRYVAAEDTLHLEQSIGYPIKLQDKVHRLKFRVQASDGIAARVARDCVPFRAADLPADPNWIVVDASIRSGLWAPIQHEKQLLGVLSVFSATPDAFTPQDERLLVLFANQVSVAMENARLFAETTRRADEFAALYQTTRDLTIPQELGTLLETIALRAMTLLRSAGGGMYLYDAARDDLVVAVTTHPSTPVGTRLKMGEGMAGRVAQTRQPLIVDDYHTWSGRSPQYEGTPYTAVIEVPMLYSGELIGILVVEEIGNRDHKFTEEDARLLSLFAAQAAGVVHSRRLLEQTERRASHLAVLNRIASAVNYAPNLSELLQVTYGEINALIAHDTFFITLYNAATNELDYRIRVDEGIRHSPEIRQLAPSFTSVVIQTKKPVHIHDWEREKDLHPTPPLFGSMKPARSWLGVPMLVGETVVGVISVQSYRLNAFSVEEEQLLTTIAAQVAVVVEKARLLEGAQRHAREQSAIGNIARALNAAWDVRQAFPAIVAELTHLCACERVSLTLLNPARDQALFVALDSPRPELAQGTWLPLHATAAADDIRAGRIHLTPDLGGEVKFAGERALYEAGFRSRVNVPLVVGDQAIGSLNLASRQLNAFKPDQLPVLQQIANALAIAIENTRLFEEEQNRRTELDALYALSRVLTDTTDADAILDLALRHAVETMRVTFARAALLDGDEFVVRAARPIRALGRELGLGRREPVAAHPCCLRVLNQNAPMVVRSDDPNVTAFERELFFLDVAQTLCLVPLRAGERALGVLMLAEARGEEREPFNAEKLRLAHSIGDQVASALQRAELFAELENSYLQSVLSLANAVDAKDTYTAIHAERLAEMAVAVGGVLGLSARELEDVRYGALLHDIGKIGVPDAILQKPGPLTEPEWVEMRRHPEVGAQIIQPIPRLAGAALVVRHHHERYDGTGYPDRLAGQAIPLAARVLTVVDAYTAIVDKRVYKAACSHAHAIAEIRKHAGTQFDPRVVDAFLDSIRP